MGQLTVDAVKEQRVSVVAFGKIKRHVTIVVHVVFLGQLVHFYVAIQMFKPNLVN
jgi:hypothetical protein